MIKVSGELCLNILIVRICHGSCDYTDGQIFMFIRSGFVHVNCHEIKQKNAKTSSTFHSNCHADIICNEILF